MFTPIIFIENVVFVMVHDSLGYEHQIPGYVPHYLLDKSGVYPRAAEVMDDD